MASGKSLDCPGPGCTAQRSRWSDPGRAPDIALPPVRAFLVIMTGLNPEAFWHVPPIRGLPDPSSPFALHHAKFVKHGGLGCPDPLDNSCLGLTLDPVVDWPLGPASPGQSVEPVATVNREGACIEHLPPRSASWVASRRELARTATAIPRRFPRLCPAITSRFWADHVTAGARKVLPPHR